MENSQPDSHIPLNVAERKYSLLVQSLSQGVIFHAADGTIVDANPAAAHILGLSRDSLLNKSSRDPRWRALRSDGTPFAPTEHPAMVALATGQPVAPVEMAVFVPEEEQYRWILVEAFPLELGDVSPIRVVAICTDITEKKHYEKRLAQSEENYRKAFAESSQAFALHEIICDEQGQPVDYRFLAINQAFEAMTGLQAENTIGRTIKEIWPSIEEHWISDYGKVALEGTTLQLEDQTGLTGKRYHVQAYRPAPRQFAVVFSDITPLYEAQEERERNRQELQRKNEELESLLHILSHDLRAPLVNLEGFSQELRLSIDSLLLHPDDPALLQDVLEAQKFIASTTARMAGVIASALQVARIGRQRTPQGIVDMNSLLQDCVRTLSHQIEASQARLEIPRLLPCHGNFQSLSQVFTNLLDNAIKYARENEAPRIVFSSRQEAGRILYSIRDFGIGIAPEQANQLFQPFHRLPSRPGIPGEGLGLANVRRMLNGMDASIQVEFPEDGAGGVIFTVSIPVVPASSAPPT